MKRIPFLIALSFPLLALSLFAQNTGNAPVTKKTGSNLINEDLVIGPGRTLDMSAGTVSFANNQIAVAKVGGLGTGVSAALTTATGNAGAFVVSGGALGTPTSGTLANATGLPLTTGVTGLLPGANGGTGVANTGKTITLGGNLTTSGAFATTLTATGTTTVTLPTTGTLATTGNLSQFAATTSAQLAGVLSDETGTGSAVFAGSPALTGVPTAPTAAPLNNSTQLSTTAYADAAMLIQQAAQLQHDGYVQSDGATPNRAAGIYGPFDAVNNPREYVAGAASLTIAAVVTVPTSNPAATALINGWGSTASNPDVNNSLLLRINTDGTLALIQWATIGSTFRQFAWGSFRSTYSGQTGFLKVYLVQGTTNPVVMWNGVDISANFTLTSSTPPAWLDAAMVPTYRFVGYNWPAGPAPIVTPILGQTSAADDAFYMATGKWPAWVVAGGGMAGDVYASANAASLKTESNSTSLLNSAGSTNTTASSVAGTRTGGSGSFFARFTSTTGGAGATNSTICINNLSKIGRRIRVSFWARSSVGTGVNFALTDNNSGGTDNASITLTTSWTQFTYDFTAYSRVNLNTVFLSGATLAIGETMDVDDMQWFDLGALSLPAVQPINVLDDVSGIGGNQGRLLGMTPVTNKTDFRVTARSVTSGNEQFMGGSLFPATNRYRISSWSIYNIGAASRTVSLGNVSAGTQYGSALTVPVGITEVTPTTRYNATADIWVNSNGTDPLVHTIAGQRIGNN